MTIDEFIAKVQAGLPKFRAAMQDDLDDPSTPLVMSEENFADIYMDWIADNGVGGDAA